MGPRSGVERLDASLGQGVRVFHRDQAAPPLPPTLARHSRTLHHHQTAVDGCRLQIAKLERAVTLRQEQAGILARRAASSLRRGQLPLAYSTALQLEAVRAILGRLAAHLLRWQVVWLGHEACVARLVREVNALHARLYSE